MKKNGSLLIVCIIGIATFVAGCRSERHYTINPDGSGKVGITLWGEIGEMGEEAGLTDFSRDILRNSKNVESWKGLSTKVEGKYVVFTGTAYFDDVNKAKVSSTAFDPKWQKIGTNEYELAIGKDDSEYTPVELTEEELQKQIGLRRKMINHYLQNATEKDLSEVGHKYIIDYPGKLIEGVNFTVTKEKALIADFRGDRIAKAVRSINADETLLKKIILSGDRRFEGPIFIKELFRQVFGTSDIVRARFTCSKPLFDYKTELLECKKNSDGMRRLLFPVQYYDDPAAVPIDNISVETDDVKLYMDSFRFYGKCSFPNTIVKIRFSSIVSFDSGDGKPYFSFEKFPMLMASNEPGDSSARLQFYIPPEAVVKEQISNVKGVIWAVTSSKTDTLICNLNPQVEESKAIDLNITKMEHGVNETKMELSFKAPENGMLKAIKIFNKQGQGDTTSGSFIKLKKGRCVISDTIQGVVDASCKLEIIYYKDCKDVKYKFFFKDLHIPKPKKK